MKSALDTIMGFLPPERFTRLVGTDSFKNAPTTVKMEGGTGTIDPPTVHEGLPSFPPFNLYDGKGAPLRGGKLKPVLVDTRAKDIRVLAEHRGDKLVAAVNEAVSGKIDGLKKYLDVFKNLDRLSGEDTFGGWFS